MLVQTRLITVPLKRVEELKYLGTTLTNQNSIQEEIKSRLKTGNAHFHLVQNLRLPVRYPKIQCTEL